MKVHIYLIGDAIIVSCVGTLWLPSEGVLCTHGKKWRLFASNALHLHRDPASPERSPCRYSLLLPIRIGGDRDAEEDCTATVTTKMISFASRKEMVEVAEDLLQVISCFASNLKFYDFGVPTSDEDYKFTFALREKS